jgi:hypothetical protein
MRNARSTPRQLAIEQAKEILTFRPLYLDTETTRLDSKDEIIEIAIIDDDEQVVFESLVSPPPIPSSATLLHGIRNEDVQFARPWPIVWQQVQPCCTTNGWSSTMPSLTCA